MRHTLSHLSRRMGLILGAGLFASVLHAAPNPIKID